MTIIAKRLDGADDQRISDALMAVLKSLASHALSPPETALVMGMTCATMLAMAMQDSGIDLPKPQIAALKKHLEERFHHGLSLRVEADSALNEARH